MTEPFRRFRSKLGQHGSTAATTAASVRNVWVSSVICMVSLAVAGEEDRPRTAGAQGFQTKIERKMERMV